LSNTLQTVIFFDLGETLINNQGKPYNDAFDTLQILQQLNYRIGLISNQSITTTVADVYSRLQSLGFSSYIEKELVTISSEIDQNLGKPNKPIFDLALQKAGHQTGSQQSIFVSEEVNHITAARSYGWRAILKRNTGTCQVADGECITQLSQLITLLPQLGNTVGTNLNLAPYPKTVDGLYAVPMDIQRITAAMTFDASTQSGIADVTIEFRTGRHTGNPIFDLRQTITSAWLNGAPFPTTKLNHHDFGGGTHAELRIIEQVLPAGSSQTLRVIYSLGTPQASTAGSYQPSISWGSGPRLTLNFGFTDLGAGRYLEAWIPANLIYDQFELILEIKLINTAIAHSVITNGQTTTVGPNNWRINFPVQFTAFSPLLEIRATDTLETSNGAASLPVSGANVAIETWKLYTNPAILATEVNNIKNYLINNDDSVGPYAHGQRFVTFLRPTGGMEYDGGTTSSPFAIQHEAYHSWWGRGVKPASQPDAWFDEGWTTYKEPGAAGAQSFNFSDPPILLRPSNPWIRITSSNAYLDGSRFWRGIAALIGQSTLDTLMCNFYKKFRNKLVTTMDFETYLITHSGNPKLVDAFHRFVYGFSDSPSTPELWLKDDPSHLGSDLWQGRFWDSPDLWVRNSDDSGLIHQSPKYGQDNWFFARVRNRGSSTVKHFVVTFNIKEFAGTQFSYPTDFLPCIAAASGFDLAPDSSVIVKAKWPKAHIPNVNYTCMLAAVISKGDQPAAGRHVREHNNLGQKNLTILHLKPDQWIIIPVVVVNAFKPIKKYHLQIVRPKNHSTLEASILHKAPELFVEAYKLKTNHLSPSIKQPSSNQLDCSGYMQSDVAKKTVSTTDQSLTDNDSVTQRFGLNIEAGFATGITASIPISLKSQEQVIVGLKVKVPSKAKKGETMLLDLIQRDKSEGAILGGIALQIHVE
jgi:hypothetical protein